MIFANDPKGPAHEAEISKCRSDKLWPGIGGVLGKLVGSIEPLGRIPWVSKIVLRAGAAVSCAMKKIDGGMFCYR